MGIYCLMLYLKHILRDGETLMKELFKLLKQGSRASLTAAIVNFIIAIAKFVAYLLTANVAMFAEMMHSLGDSINQFFVFIGSSLSKKAPTKRFPFGFGRLVNLVCLFAVIFVGILSYETVREGIHHLIEPLPGDTDVTNLIINLSVLFIGVILELFVLYKAGTELLEQANLKTGGLRPITTAYIHMNRAKPATKLVFLEDTVAIVGGLLAMVAILLGFFTSIDIGEGIASILIGLMMFYIVYKIFMENAAGVLGEHDPYMEGQVSTIILNHPDIVDIKSLIILKEGESLHIEAIAEINKDLKIERATDIREEVEELLYKQSHVTDVNLEFTEDDGERAWPETQNEIDNPKY